MDNRSIGNQSTLSRGLFFLNKNSKDNNNKAAIPYLVPGSVKGSLSGIKYLVSTTVVPPIVADSDASKAPIYLCLTIIF